MPQRVSLCLITKNEEANLAACLNSAADLVAEMVVVDTGSSDRTKEVAASCGAQVFDFAWVDDFAAARNESVRHATGEWILWLDGDESFNEENRAKLGPLFSGLLDEKAAHVMKQRSWPDSFRSSATVVDQVRLFRNDPAVRWQYRVHEQILMAVRRAGHAVHFTDVLIDHVGYEDPALRGRKTQRNLRLLHLEDAGRPDDPFTLFNLGWTYQEIGEPAKALPYLRRSLERSQPGDSIVRKLYALLAQGHRQLGQWQEALTLCRAGQARYPDDAELLFLEGQLLRDRGDRSAARASFLQLINTPPGAYFASLDAGPRGPKARHQLAELSQEQGQYRDAEAHWQAALALQPTFAPARLGLAELYLAQRRWQELEPILAELANDPGWTVEAEVVRARSLLARKEFAAARQVLETAIARAPREVRPRVILTHVLLQEGREDSAAEQALRAVLELDPLHTEAWRNLALLLNRQGRRAEALQVCAQAELHCPHHADILFQHGLLLSEAGQDHEAERCWLHFLERQPRTDPSSNALAQRNAARHHLALLYARQRRFLQADAQWRAVLGEQPDSATAWLGLADLCLEQRWNEVEPIAQRLGKDAQAPMEAGVLRARAHLAR